MYVEIKGYSGQVMLIIFRHATFLGWQSVFLTKNSVRIRI